MAKIYVSSTILDLEAERRAVMDWLRGAKHQAVDSYLPNSEDVRESCLKDIDGCDLYVLILGHRYGFQPVKENPDNLSITHLEFRRAGTSKIPRVALLRSTVPNIGLSDLEDPKRSPLVLAFRNEVQREVRPAEFSDLAGLIQGLSTGVPQELQKLNTSADDRNERLLAGHLQNVSRQFATHIAASALRPGAAARDQYLDLMVARRQPGNQPQTRSDQETNARDSRPLEEVIQQARSPLLVIGEGGAGKTTSLLYLAARQADRARSDPTAAMPIYVNLGRLTKLTDMPELLQLIADSVAGVDGWDELAELVRQRPILFLFDSFNEIPEQLQRDCAVLLLRFVDKQGSRHVCVIGSRIVPSLEHVARPPSPFEMFEILRLTNDRVQAFLKNLGLGSLYERMPRELRDLAGNPFMLVAIAQTLAGKPEGALPRNQGRLYQEFAQSWMAREEAKHRSLKYSYERVKEPLLAHTAKRMTAAGQTSLALDKDTADEIESLLRDIHERFRRRGGIPETWTVDDCLDELVADGLLRRVNEQLYFMHQSVQEYFTALFFDEARSDALASFMPELVWGSVSTYALAEAPKHRLVPAFLMLAGLLDDATQIIESVAARNPVLAAAAISSANRVQTTLLASLEKRWLGLLQDKDLKHRIVGCSCLVLASMRAPGVVKRLVEFALGTNFDNSYVGIPALGKLRAPTYVASEITESVRSLSEDDLDKQGRKFAEALEQVQCPAVMNMFFEHWRNSEPGSEFRHRMEGLLATVDRTLLTDELQRIRSGTADAAVTADTEQVLAQCASWRGLRSGIMSAAEARRLSDQARGKYEARNRQATENLRSASPGELLEALGADDVAVRAAAATIAAERRLPVADEIIDSLLRREHSDLSGMVAAIVSLLGEGSAVSKLVEHSLEKVWRVGSVTPGLVAQLEPHNAAPDALAKEFMRLGRPDNLCEVAKRSNDDGTTVRILEPSSWSGFRPAYEIRASATTAEFYDCNLAPRAVTAVTNIPGDASLFELQRAVEHEDERVRTIALEELASRSVAALKGNAAGLLEELMSAKSPKFIDLALHALGQLRSREALSLVNDVLVIHRGEWSDVHPVWGPCPHSPGWADAIHRILVRLNADEDIQQTLDKALASDSPETQTAALNEFSRWFRQRDLEPERRASWRSGDRIQQILGLALDSSVESVRDKAIDTLKLVDFDVIKATLLEKLADSSPAVQLAAANALVRLSAEEQYARVTQLALEIIKTRDRPDLRRQAGRILSLIPGGVETFYRPIQEALTRDDEHALQLIESAVEVFPDDVNFMWWRGHALRGLGRLEDAAQSFERACELDKNASVIPQALAETFLEVEQFPRAMEMARRAVEIAPDDSDAQATLAWSSYKASAIPAAVEAASKAVALDPVHAVAIWVAVLGNLREANQEKARAAFRHALRVRQVLSPGYDDSFMPKFLKELDAIETGQSGITPLVQEIKAALNVAVRRS